MHAGVGLAPPVLTRHDATFHAFAEERLEDSGWRVDMRRLNRRRDIAHGRQAALSRERDW